MWPVTPLLILYSAITALGAAPQPMTLTLGAGTAAPADPFWLETIKHQGSAPFHPDATNYKVFRNVKDFGAIGDGVHDDSDAINLAISSGGRCGGGTCSSSTVSPAIIYFPTGTYLVSKSIIPYYFTQLIGDARHPPTLLAAPTFDSIAVIDMNPYTANGQWFTNQNTFFRSIRNFIIDVRQVPFWKSQGTGIHWQVAQATSLMNIVVEMSREPGTAHQGIWMENGSGGFMGDLVFNGGKFGMWVGNQQFTVRNITVNNAEIGVFGVWNWGWTYQGININNCQVGFDLTTAGSVAAEAIRDVTVKDTPIFLRLSVGAPDSLSTSVVLNNIKLENVPTAIGVVGGEVLLAGTTGSMTIPTWAQGNKYTGASGAYSVGDLPDVNLPSILLDSEGKVVQRAHPQYEAYSVSQFVSVKDYGAKGDGQTDDTAAIQSILNNFANRKIIFFDAGQYVLTDTITIPPGSRLVGEAWTVIGGSGPKFQDKQYPRPIVRVGKEGSTGIAEITDIVFTTYGPAAGAIVVEWNIKGSYPGAAGMWDSYIRLGGAAGSNLQAGTCGVGVAADPAVCMAAFLALHLTPKSSAYLEGTWVWLADHDLDHPQEIQISIYAGRGILSESQGPVWMIGTAEHFTLYQYNLVNAKNHYLGLAQTESPYFQPSPPATSPYPPVAKYNDPSFPNDLTSAWALSVTSSSNIFVFGAGLYSFYNNYSQDCLGTRNCQNQIVNIDANSDVKIWSLSTVASTKQISVDGVGIIDQNDNLNGFASTITFWKP